MNGTAGRHSEAVVSSPQDDPRVTRALEEYLAALEAGRLPDRQDFLAGHADIAPALARCLEGLEFLHTAAPLVRESGEEDPAVSATSIDAEGPLGDYRIVREVGRGGMGVVYEAVQISLGRRVALKVLPFAAAMDARQLQRFKNEAQAAACLHHSNIVPVFAVGSERGVHYYAMQYIDGQTLASLILELRKQVGQDTAPSAASAGATGALISELFSTCPPPAKYSGPGSQPTEPYSPLSTPAAADTVATPRPSAVATEQSLRSPEFFRTVARLGVQAAEALEHAHQLGVVHRDIKPANLLLETCSPLSPHPRPLSTWGRRENQAPPSPWGKAVGGEGLRLWITDFGLAWCQSQGGLTLTGDLIGTLRYMSPEQALAQRTVVDHRTDVYSLGATLYELLTLEPVFRGRDRQELLRQIAFEEPLPPRRNNRAVPAELETIVLKALEKRPAERYVSAQELADDLARFLRDEPIRAKRPTLWQQVKKWARRNRPLVWSLAVSGSVLLILTVIGLVLSNVYISREKKDKERALDEARQNFETAEANFLLAHQAVEEMWLEVATELGVLPHMHPFQRKVLQKALRFYQEFSQRKGNDATSRLLRAAAAYEVQAIEASLDLRQVPEQTCREAIAELEELANELPQEPRLQRTLGDAYLNLAGILGKAGRHLEAEKSQRQALALYQQLTGGHPDVPQYQSGLASIYQGLGSLLHRRPHEAEQWYRDATTLYQKLVAGWPGEARYQGGPVGCHISLGRLLADLGLPQQAEQAFCKAIDLYEKEQRALDQSSYRHLWAEAEYRLGGLLMASGQLPRAEKAFRHAIALGERLVLLFPDISSYRESLASYYGELARVLYQKKLPEEVKVFLHSTREVVDKLLADFPEGVGNRAQPVNWLLILGGVQRDLHDLPAAERTTGRALKLASKRAADHPTEPGIRESLAETHWSLGILFQWTSRLREAADEFQQALAIWEQLAAEFPGEPNYRWRRANMHNFLGIALRTLPAEAPAAAKNHRQALELCEVLVSEFPDVLSYRVELVRSHYALGIALELAGHCAEAEQCLHQALAAYRPEIQSSSRTRHQLLASIHNDLAWLQATRPDVPFRDPAGAVASACKAVELDPTKGAYWNTLGVAYCQARQAKEALAALAKSMELRRGGDSFDWFFLAMAHAQLGQKEDAWKWHKKAIEWMDKHQPGNSELRRFREEAATLLNVR
jgi:serine/threonine protein kinase